MKPVWQFFFKIIFYEQSKKNYFILGYGMHFDLQNLK